MIRTIAVSIVVFILRIFSKFRNILLFELFYSHNSKINWYYKLSMMRIYVLLFKHIYGSGLLPLLIAFQIIKFIKIRPMKTSKSIVQYLTTVMMDGGSRGMRIVNFAIILSLLYHVYNNVLNVWLISSQIFNLGQNLVYLFDFWVLIPNRDRNFLKKNILNCFILIYINSPNVVTYSKAKPKLSTWTLITKFFL